MAKTRNKKKHKGQHKRRDHNRPVAAPSSVSPPVAAAVAEPPREVQTPEPATVSTSDFYYVRSEVRRIGLLALLFVGLEVGFWIVAHLTSLGSKL